MAAAASSLAASSVRSAAPEARMRLDGVREIALDLVALAHHAGPRTLRSSPVAVFARVDHGQGELAFPEVVADRLADDGR